MKTLSLRQPWTSLVVNYGKWIENRRWNTTFRGEFLIHAAKGMTRREFDEAFEFAHEVMGDKCPTEAQLRATLLFGGIVGRAKIVTVVPPIVEPMLLDVSSYYPRDIERRWHMRDQYGFVLDDVQSVPFRAVRGELGFFEVADA